MATIAAFVGQHIVRRMIILFGRASLIIFILAFTIFVSAISLGKQHYSASLFRFVKYIALETSNNLTPLNFKRLVITFVYNIGGVGISNMIGKIHQHEYMGFENLCKYDA